MAKFGLWEKIAKKGKKKLKDELRQEPTDMCCPCCCYVHPETTVVQ